MEGITQHKRQGGKAHVAFQVFLKRHRLFSLAFGLACCTATLCGCSNDMQKVKMFDRHTLPDETMEGAIITHSSNGVRQMRLAAPLIYRYSKPERKVVYPQGVYVDFLKDGKRSVNLTARYAISLEERKTMMARDSVVIIDFSSGDTIYLSDIIWNQKDGILYSNHPVRSQNGQRKTYGDGFLSDENFENAKIYRQRGTVEWADTAGN
ncbi:MAG: LPS export ABC transporter periplasmic protein LptC [Bacteroidales bacterium]|nr:LPS export ABC transporter periplasmic protein LptC [Bacteroidales bacterium]